MNCRVFMMFPYNNKNSKYEMFFLRNSVNSVESISSKNQQIQNHHDHANFYPTD